ncbi:MAG TPA: molybdopterin-dependent oxidoreductase, partial [Phycisphaerae bacterium]
MDAAPQIFKSTCSYCGVGCGIEILKHAGGQLELRGDESNPANRGLLCSKGRSLLHTVRARAARLHYPVMRAAKAGPRERVSWDAAMERVAGDFQRIIAQHGPDSVAFYISGQCLTEEYYLANKLVKGFLRTNNIDTNSRLCMSSAVCGYKATLGADSPPVCYDDIDACDTFFIAGANPAWCHPVLFRRIEARKAADPNVRVIVVDPRKTASTQDADLHLQLRPGTDVALFLGIARRLAHTHQIDRNFLALHTDGAAAFLESAEPWTLARTAEVTGLDPADIAQAAEWLGANRRFLSLWTMGLNQSAVGTDKNIAIISLSLITGKIGRPGCGPFSLTGQPNAMGGREVGGMASLLPAHRDLANPAHRQEVARFWGVPAISPTPGLTAVELFDALHAGKVKAVWIIATNPLASLPSSWNAEKALAQAQLVVVQDIYPTETTHMADVILPAAGWLEKTGTMTNSDRRISLLEKAVEPPGEALPDAQILLRFAHAMGWGDSFAYENAADIFAEHAALTSGTDVDITGLSHELLRSHGTRQWPAPKQNTPNANLQTSGRLFTNHHFASPSGHARLYPLAFQDRSEQPTPEHPLILTTGRIRDQWHTMTKTGQVNRLRTHIDSPFCEIHPADAAARGIREGDVVTISNSRGEVRVRAVITDGIRPGVIFLPMHWGKRLAGDSAARGRANNLTSPRLDPVSKEPDLKLAAVQAGRYLPPMRRIVIIGAGAAALGFIEEHRHHNSRDDIVLLGGESLPVYNRVMLPHYIDGSAPWESLICADRDSLTPHRVIYHPNTLVSRIDRDHKIVTDSSGRAFAYDLLILATGSRPAIHYDGPIPDQGVFTLRTRRDADGILAAGIKSGGAQHAVIHGGGLLGLELADALRSLGCEVTILQRSDRLMGKQLDEVASAHLAQELELRGIHVLFHSTPVELIGSQSLKGVRVAVAEGGGAEMPAVRYKTLPADLFVFATGTLPNKELAGAASGGGLDCERGILINEQMQTSDPAIFAIGECAERDGMTVGTTAGAREQARALAQYLRGNEHAPYKFGVAAAILKIKGLKLAAAGITAPLPEDPSYETITFHDVRRRIYQKCVIKDDRLVGVICLGDTTQFQRYLEYIQSGIELEDLRNTLFGTVQPAAPLDGPLVCSCHHVGAGSIEKAGAQTHWDMARTCASTKAGTGCGSCRPEIAGIL